MKQANYEKHNKIQQLRPDEQSIGLSCVENARELGGIKSANGKKVKPGRLIRSGQLSAAGKEDIMLLNDTLRVGVVVDLRSPGEAAGIPEPSGLRAKYLNLPLLDDPKQTYFFEDVPPESTTNLYYRIMFGGTAVKSYGKFFRLLLEYDEERPVLFHSVRGRDRAGVASALLLSLLGVPDETIFAEYMLSKGVFAHTLGYIFSRANVEYGSVTEYVRAICGLSAGDITELKHKYLD